MKKNIIESECNKPQSSDTTIVLQQDKVIRSVSSGGFDLNENSKKYKCYEIKNKVIEPYLNKINRYYIDSNGCLKRNKKVTIKKFIILSHTKFFNFFKLLLNPVKPYILKTIIFLFPPILISILLILLLNFIFSDIVKIKISDSDFIFIVITIIVSVSSLFGIIQTILHSKKLSNIEQKNLNIPKLRFENTEQITKKDFLSSLNEIYQVSIVSDYDYETSNIFIKLENIGLGHACKVRVFSSKDLSSFSTPHELIIKKGSEIIIHLMYNINYDDNSCVYIGFTDILENFYLLKYKILVKNDREKRATFFDVSNTITSSVEAELKQMVFNPVYSL